jgi:uncharacterized protein YukE
MADGIEASAKAIIDLTRDINNDIKKINMLGNELSSQLKTLGSTFRDEGYITIQSYIAKTQQKVNDAVPDLKTVMEKLIEYAELIKESRGSV